MTKTVAAALAALSLFILAGTQTAAQSKIGWFNSAEIMEKLPEAQDAQYQIDNLIADWQEELAKLQNDWQRMYEEYDKKKRKIITSCLISAFHQK